jgi:hypothetical protein
VGHFFSKVKVVNDKIVCLATFGAFSPQTHPVTLCTREAHLNIDDGNQEMGRSNFLRSEGPLSLLHYIYTHTKVRQVNSNQVNPCLPKNWRRGPVGITSASEPWFESRHGIRFF